MRILAVALAFWPGIAAAEGCLDQVRELAKSQNISTDPPTASPDKAPGAPGQGTGPGVTSRELGRSGGVIEPPATSDRSVITPPATTDNRMPTMPDVTPKPATPSPQGQTRGAQEQAKKDDAADRTVLQAVLVAARAEAERGQEANCLDGLKKARELLKRAEK